MPEDFDVPLFDWPEPPRRRASPAPAGVSASRYSVKARVLCGDCVALIHALGVESAPYPKTARWRVASPEGVAYVCEAHKQQRMEKP